MVTGRQVVDRLRRVDENHFLLVDATSRITYEGRTDNYLDPDTSKAIWQIKRTAFTNGAWETTYADSGKYNCIWNDRADYFSPVGGEEPPNTSESSRGFLFAVTELNTTEIKQIAVPEGATACVMYHVEAGETAWIGNTESDMAAGTSNGAAPVIADMPIRLEFVKDQEIEMFGTVTAGTLKIYVIGVGA